MIILLIGDKSKCKNHVNVIGLRDIRSDSFGYTWFLFVYLSSMSSSNGLSYNKVQFWSVLVGCHATTARVRPFSGLIWATWATTQHMLGPI